MKTFIQLLLAGITGGAIALAGLNVFESKQTVHPDTPTPSFVNFNQSPSNNMPGDFVESAKKSTGSVVHIFAEESDEQVLAKRKKQRRNDPFSDFLVLMTFLEVVIFMDRKTEVVQG